MAPDVRFYHSGGGSNCDPNKDLGGSISSCEVSNNINNLFDDLTPTQSRDGLIDYRCVYIKNSSASEVLRDTKVYIDSERQGGSLVDLGYCLEDEFQAVQISGTQPPNEGDFFILDVTPYGTFSVTYNVLLPMWQGRFQTQMRGLDGLNDVIVDAVGVIGFPTEVVFSVDFIDDAGSRKLSTIQVADNSLTGCQISVIEIIPGCPISTTAIATLTQTTAPAGIVFDYPARGNPIDLGDMRPQESFPLWFRRTTPSNTVAYIQNNVVIRVDGTFP